MDNVQINSDVAGHVIPLWHHQSQALVKATERYALFFDPGTGKTRTAIELFKKSVPRATTFRKVIIFAPISVCHNWEVELEKYLDLPYHVSVIAGQTKSKRLRMLTEFRESQLQEENQILVCNIETLRSKDYQFLLCNSGATFMIVDESHNFKSSTSLQTKGLMSVCGNLPLKHLYLLTGTPAPNGEIDLWSTFTLLRKNKDNFFVWRKKYFEDENERRRGTHGYYPSYKIRQSSKEYFKKLLSECSMTARKDEVLDLPPLLRTNIYAELGREQKRHYDTMKEYLFAIDSEGHELNASNMLIRTLRMQQILAGFLGEVPVKGNPRLDALQDAISLTNGEQFIIWTIFRATYPEIYGKLFKQEIKHVSLTGDQTPEERQENIDAFQSGKARAIIAHPRVGGVGVNLTAASYSIHYTRSYSLTDDLQAEARNYRGGSEIHKRITRIDIIAPGTIDEDIAEALRQKKSVQDFILGLKEKHGK